MLTGIIFNDFPKIIEISILTVIKVNVSVCSLATSETSALGSGSGLLPRFLGFRYFKILMVYLVARQLEGDTVTTTTTT